MLKLLMKKLKANVDAMNVIMNLATKEERELSEDEMKEVEDYQAKIEKLKAQIEAAKAQEANLALLNESAGTSAADDDGQYNGGVAPAVNRKIGTGGFKSFGEFLGAVAKAGSKTNPIIDDRLRAQSGVNTQTGTDGGHAVPTDFRQEITRKVVEEESILPHFNPIYSEVGTYSRLVDQNDPSNPYGVKAHWVEEGETLVGTKPVLDMFTNRAPKLAALIPMTNESLKDATLMSSIVMRAAPAAMGYKINDALVNGNGIGKPKGIMNLDHLHTIAKEAGQANGTIVFKNVLKMLESIPGSVRSKAIWFSGLNTLSQLMSLKDDNGNAVFIQGGSLANRPHDVLLGLPKYELEYCAPLGQLGDLVLLNPGAYEVILEGTGIKSDFSTHIYFDEDKSAFRFTFKVGGNCPFKNVITRKGTITQSNMVTLAAR